MPRKPAAAPPVRRRPGRPRGGVVAADTRQAIVEAAIRCFARQGYDKASNRRIATDAGVTATLLYHYFDSKPALYRCALQSANRMLVDAYRSAAAEIPDATSMEQLCLGLEKALALSRRYVGLMAFAAASAGEIARHDELDWLDPADAAAFPEFFRALLGRARRRGELASGVDIEAAAQMLVACISGLAALDGTPTGTRDLAALLSAFQGMLRGDLMPAHGRARACNPEMKPRNAGELTA
jgi:AcrR family transcriptional regulator